MTPLEILWRNPYPVGARCRRRRFEREGKNSFTFCGSSCKDTAVTGQRYPIWRLWWWEGSLIHREIASTQ
jgi:hypothetical protein